MLLCGSFFNDRVNIVLAIVFSATTDTSKDGEAWGCCSIGVDVNDFAALYVLKKPHCSITSIVSHHFSVLLALSNIVSWVLEIATLTIVTL